MAMRKTKPTSPGRRFATYQKREELTGGNEPLKALTKGKTPQRRTQRRTAASPRATAAAAPSAATARSTSSAARTGSRRRSPRSSTTRTAPATSRCCTTSTARRATSSRRRASTVGAMVESGESADIRPGNALPLRSIPTGTVVHNVELVARPGRQARPLRRLGDPGGREGGRLVTLRLPSSEMRLVRAECRATVGTPLERRAPERQDRQGRPQPPQGQAAADAAGSR